MSLPSDLKFAEQLVLTYQNRDKTKLAFMKLYEPEKDSFEDKLWKMKEWAKRCHSNTRMSSVDPDILDNVPQEGIEVTQHVSRSWLSNNKVWRVKDPRGFEMEISSANFDKLLDHTDVVDRTFQVPLIWLQRTKGGDAMWLVPAGSKTHKDAIKRHEIQNQRISLRDVNRGDVVRLHDGRKVLYLGGMYHYQHPRYLSQQGELKDPSRTYFFVVRGGETVHDTYASNKEGVLDTKSSLKVGQILDRAEEPMTKQEAETLANEKLDDEKCNDAFIPFVRASKFTKEEVEVRNGKCYVDGDEYKIRRKDTAQLWYKGKRQTMTFD